MALELILHSAELNLPQTIENLEQLKAELIPRLDKYNNLVVTEDSIRAAKADKSNLNKLKKLIDEQRRAIKKQYLEPYQLLENQCKEVIALIDEPIQAIDRQIKSFDETERAQKLEKLHAAFIKLTPPVWLDFKQVLPEKWANKTEKTEKLEAEMQAAVLKIKSEFAKIQAIYRDRPFLIAVLNRYQDNLSKADTLAYAAELEKQYQEQVKQYQEQVKMQMSPETALNAPVSHANESSIVTPVNAQNGISGGSDGNMNASDNAERIVTGAFRVRGTAIQIKALGNFMRENGIKFEVIK